MNEPIDGAQVQSAVDQSADTIHPQSISLHRRLNGHLTTMSPWQ
jgi:hypothetical protein